ncbi:hypothetical protein SADUNF_Sadunf14G0098900 [Salix dunnii]|uniref:Peptidyl-prolyl cis-trans isomerase n=1 Tax=Salix dunnii TaxID=1413687 RepID=A0A835MTT5_9ROSI|nr:hypothetical protein SADUNF_Sadunf14G0098900 [Salix dunnii]
MSNLKVFFDILICKMKAGRIVMELYADATPETVEKFRALCIGKKGIGNAGKPLHYKGSTFHRIIPNFMCQNGDFTREKTSWLDEKHVVFGKVVNGYSVVQEMEKLRSNSGTTKEPVVVEYCGQIIEN